jgi:hypothetical protein
MIIDQHAGAVPFLWRFFPEWKVLPDDTPKWIRACATLLSLFALAHFIWVGLQNGMGVPAIINGQYVLEIS